MTATTVDRSPETGAPQKGWAGQSIPRKEDKRLIQGEGVFVDDVKRHGMGYVHFVRSPYAHARDRAHRRVQGRGPRGRLRDADRRRGRGPDRPVLPDRDSARRGHQGLRARGRQGPPRRRARRRGRRATRELARDAAELVEIDYEPLPVLVDARRPRRTMRRCCMRRSAQPDLARPFDWGDYDAASRRPTTSSDRAAALRPLLVDAARVQRRARRVQPRHRPVDDARNNQFPGFATIMMAPAMRVGIDKLRFVTQDIGGGFGNKISCTRTRRVLPAGAEAEPARAVDGVAHRPAHGELARQRADLPRRRGGREGRRDDARVPARTIDDCGAFPRYEPLGCIIWSQVTPGMYRWRNIRVDFTQVARTSRRRAEPRLLAVQHLWLTERIDIVAQELGIDPVEMRKRNYVRADEMPYETPNGCVYDSGDYAQALDEALKLAGYETIEERRREAESRGKLLGVGIGSTLDSGTNNFGQSTLINPELQFSGNNEVATVKLDIFGEIVVTLGTVPQGQGHETTASQLVADILSVTPDDVHVRPGHDSFWNSHAGFSGTYASQFAVTGLSAVKGAAENLAWEIKRVAGGVFGIEPDDVELAEGRRASGKPRGRDPVHGHRRDREREQRHPAAGRPRRDAQLPLRLRATVPAAGQGAQVRQPHAHLRHADPRLRDRDRPGDGRV